MDLAKIREKKIQLEQNILQCIEAFEKETTILVKEIETYRAVSDVNDKVATTFKVHVSTIVF